MSSDCESVNNLSRSDLGTRVRPNDCSRCVVAAVTHTHEGAAAGWPRLVEGGGVGKAPCSKPASFTAKAPFSADFHITSLNWTSSGIELGLDGVIVNRISSPCLVQAIGMHFDRETMPGWMQLPDPETLPDQPFEVDYVRSYRRLDDVIATTVRPLKTDESDNSSTTVLEWGAVGDGVHDDSSAIQSAIDSLPNDGGIVRFPRGIFALGSSLIVTNRQVCLLGDSYISVLLVPLVELQLGTISLRASDCEVSNLNVRTKGPTALAFVDCVGILVQGAPYAMIRNVQFTSDLNGEGIVFDDRGVDGKLRAGSYMHTVEDCYIGRPYRGTGTFRRGIATRGTEGGINACQIRSSHFIGDVAIEWKWGGGNFFTGNVFQSLTGSVHKGVGYAIFLNKFGSATVTNNYIENYEAAVYPGLIDRNPRDTSTTVAFNGE